MNNEQNSFIRITIVFIGVIVLMIAFGCRKQEITVQAVIGNTYHIKSNVFHKGSFQPLQPVRVDSLYIDGLTQMRYAKIHAQIDWNNFDINFLGNSILLQDGGIVQGDPKYLDWAIPVEDLSK